MKLKFIHRDEAAALTADTDLLSKGVQKNGWLLDGETLRGFDAGTLEYAGFELAADERTLENYHARVRFLGLTELDQVLDFGCGIGQWSIVLASYNKSVVGIDRAKSRLTFANALKASMGINNVRFDSDGLGCAEGSFDAIFCYSVFMFLDGPEAADWFARLLKPGGKLYLMVDLPAWHLRSIFRSPKYILGIGYMLLSTLLRRKRNVIYTKGRLKRLMMNSGFTVVSEGADGQASFSAHGQPSSRSRPFLDNQFCGMQTLYEVCAVKR